MEGASMSFAAALVLLLHWCAIGVRGGSGSALKVVPQFTKPIHNATVAVGREATLECSVNDLGNYKVAWLREDQTIFSVHNRVITHNPRIGVTYDDNPPTWKLHIRQLKETDQACYICQINTDSMMSQSGCIQVQVPPDIRDNETSGDVTVKEGENATLVCRATGHPEPRILWRREDGLPILVHPGVHETRKVDSFSGSELILSRIERHQMGAYLCIASNDVPPAVSKRIMVNVNFSPVIKVPNQLFGAPLNTDVQLDCHVEAFPNTINYWVKAKSEILITGTKHTIVESRNGFRVHMKLIIHNIQKRDIGTYLCVAKNSIGKADGTLRLYEIKIAQTKAPSTSTTTTTTTEMQTESSTVTTTTYHTVTRPSTTTIGFDALLEEVDNNFLPSAEPAPLETLHASVSSTNVISGSYFANFLVVILFLR